MIELETALANYLETKAQNRLVPGKNSSPALVALRADMPNVLKSLIQRAGYPAEDFLVKGSVGEPNRSFAKVPWVAVFKTSICRSATKGYYIVFLFAQDMSSVTMSLNQGYTAFEERYVHPKVAYPKLRDCARAARNHLGEIPAGFDLGPIDLRTDGTLARGYEAGSILSKSYAAGLIPSHDELFEDFSTLLTCYVELSRRFPASLIDLDVAISENQILEAAEKFDLVSPGTPKTTGPQPPPPLGLIGTKTKHIRSVEVVASALAMANAECSLGELGSPHITFPSAKTKKNYVEAHHFIPFSQQTNFQVSLDVEENIAVLCPNCHRMLHHGTSASKAAHLASIFRRRESSLKSRGIDVSLDDVLKMYRALDSDD